MRNLVLIGIGGMVALACAADSLYNPNDKLQANPISNRTLDYKEGDIITVLVDESIDASTESNLDTRKETSTESEALQADNPFLTAQKPAGLGIIDPEKLPNWAIDLKNEQRTRGTTKRSNRLRTTVSCVVTGVHDNGNVELEGQKRVTVNREDSTLTVRGMVRGKDISPSNSVKSSQLANAIIELRGRGPLWNNQRRGLITRLLDWVSPF